MTPPRQSDSQPQLSEFEAWVDAAVAETEAKIACCHLERACPRCGAELGEPCHSLARCSTARPHPVKHPHRERWGVPAR